MTTLAFPDTAGQPTDGSFTYEANGVIYSWTGEYWAANNAQGFDHRYVNADGDEFADVDTMQGSAICGNGSGNYNDSYNYSVQEKSIYSFQTHQEQVQTHQLILLVI